jgi:hypothetical protein
MKKPNYLVPWITSACLGRHGHYALVPPPPEVAPVPRAPRPDHVLVEGHWDRVNDRWFWRDAEWLPAQPGAEWEQGAWLVAEGAYYYRPGHWRSAAR